MNNFIAIELTEFQKKVNGYLMMFNYQLTNYCVKAEPTAMLPVTVVLSGTEYNFEEVAYATKPDAYTFDVYPKNQNNLQAIIDGVFNMHPEFKMETKTDKNANDQEVTHIIYTMPDVDKERRDLLIDTSKAFHKECVANLDACYAKQQEKIVEALSQMNAVEVNEAKTGFKSIYDEAKKQADELLSSKLSEIEDGYQRYLTQQDETGNGEYVDYTKGMRLDQMDE